MRPEALDKIDRKTGKIIGIRWKFWTYCPERKRQVPVPTAQIPVHIRESQDCAVVEAYVKSQNALEDSKRHRAEQRLKWREQYSDFTALADKFAKYHKERARNSWETDLFYLERYVFHFFLGLRSYNNLYDWKYHFEDLKEWLRETKPLKVKKDRLAKNTQNKVIKAMNRFLAWAYQVNVLSELQPKCEVYPRDELPQVQPEDLFSKKREHNEVQLILDQLQQIRPASARLFRFLVNSGCRLNEGLGVCLPFVVEGEIDGEHSRRIHEKLRTYGMDKYYGYIVLMNQPELDSMRVDTEFKSPITGRTWEPGQVPRKPMKHRKAERAEDWRYIPIYDKDTWNMLADLWNEQDEKREAGVHGPNPQDYLLFEGISAAMFYVDLVKATERAKLRFRSPHKARHTYLSWFYAQTDEDPFLARRVGGHKDQGSREVYSHIAQQIGMEQKLATQSKKRMGKVS